MLHAVIGIGSNSTRLLMADVAGGALAQEFRMREGTRLFAGLEDGMLSGESMIRTADAAARFAQTARARGAQRLHILATSAARDAGNGHEFAELIAVYCGEPLQIISGEEEARLSFIGGAGQGYCGLIDIGGGSTEIAIGGDGHAFRAASAQMGAVRLFGQTPLLMGEGLSRAYSAARARLGEVWVTLAPSVPPAAWYGVGGTMTCLASMDMALAQFDREAVHGHRMSRDTVENWARRLAKLSAEQRAQLPGILPQRADIIGHGAVVLWAVMDAADIAQIAVSNRTNLDGYLLEIAAGQ